MTEERCPPRKRAGIELGALMACALWVGAALVGCERKADPHDAPPSTEAGPLEELPSLELRDDTPGLLLTWVDEQGDFHIAQAPSQVPESARETVRVVVQGKPAGTTESVYVANLRQKGADGRYPVRTMKRSEWDELGAARRRARLAELEPPVQTPPPDAASGVIIYGADWCKPCHLAEDYLRERKVPVVMKDIEEDPAAHEEMKRKLAAANLRGASIPVIDVGGTLVVGFSPRTLDAALKKLPPSTTP